MASIIKVDQIQSDTGVMNLSSGLVYIDQNNRRVGIGNTSPSQILEITDTAPRVNFISTNNDSGARYNTDGTATNSHRWQYQGVTQMGLTSGGTLDLPYGQLKFPATQNASSDPNTLDDYEEGTWTPTDISGAGLTFTVQRCSYTKIGNRVNLTAYFTFPSTASTASIGLGGAPFASVNWGAVGIISSNSSQSALVRKTSTGTQFDVKQLINDTNVTNAQFSSCFVLFSLTYEAAT